MLGWHVEHRQDGHGAPFRAHQADPWQLWHRAPAAGLEAGQEACSGGTASLTNPSSFGSVQSVGGAVCPMLWTHMASFPRLFNSLSK